MVGVTVSNSSASFHQIHFSDNVNGLDCISGAVVTVTESDFQANTNAAMRVQGSTVTVRGCAFRGNALGGIESTMVLTNCVKAEVFQSEFYDNSAAGVEVSGGQDVVLANNVFVYNEYGVVVASDSCVISSNIVCHNTIGIAVDNVQPLICYNDVWNNTESDYLDAPTPVGDLETHNSRGTPSDSLYNISADPLFRDLDTRDLRIQSNSPCVDAGDPSNPALVAYSGAAPDIGAHEAEGTVPVELVGFRCENGRLFWRTESESGNWGFVVERSTDGLHWEQIGFVRGHGTSDQAHEYSFRDPDAREGEVFYRLVQIDLDGTRTLYGPLRARSSAGLRPQLTIFPNPTNSAALLRVRLGAHAGTEAQAPKTITLTIYDARGRAVRRYEMNLAAEGLRLRWDGRDQNHTPVPSGVYTVVAETENLRLSGKLTLLR